MTSDAAPRPLLGAALVLCAASLWATFGLFAKSLNAAGYNPLELASVRTSVGLVCLLLYALPALVRGRARVPLRALPFFAAYGTLGFALFALIFFAVFERTTVSVAVALLYTAPAFVVIMSKVLWRERIHRARLVALLLVLTGVMLVTGAVGAVMRGTALLRTDALLLGLAAGMGYAIYTMFSKVATDRYGPLPSLLWSFAFAALALAVLAPPVEPLLRSPRHIPLLLALGIVPTIVPYAIYLVALRMLRASTAAMLASAEPVVAALLAAFVLGERMDALQAGGMALVVLAAVLLAREATHA